MLAKLEKELADTEWHISAAPNSTRGSKKAINGIDIDLDMLSRLGERKNSLCKRIKQHKEDTALIRRWTGKFPQNMGKLYIKCSNP